MNSLRLKRVRHFMVQAKIDHLLLSSPDAIYYLLDESFNPGERMLVLSITQTDTKLILSALFPIQRDLGVEVIHFNDSQNPIELLATDIRDGITVGIDKNWASHFLLKLMTLKKEVHYKEGSLCIDHARLCKDDEEIQRMREASKINDQVISEIIEIIKAEGKSGNLTERMLQKKVIEINEKHGVHEMSFTPTICFGANGAQPHHDTDDTILTENQAIVIDIGGRLNGYCSDMTRSLYFGTPSDKYKMVYELVLKANLAAIDAVKPGVPLSEVDAAARRVISDAGYGDYFTHRTGHGIGIMVHEFPDVSDRSESICQEGMIFSIEPGIYLLGEFGVRIEDLLCVTNTGCEVLNAYPKDLICLL